MPAILTINQRISSATKFLNSFSDSGVNTYVFIGNISPWSNDTLPPLPVDSTNLTSDTFRKMLAGKKLVGSNVSLVIPRKNWTVNTIYSEYSDILDVTRPNVGTPPFYVMTDELNVYKCIFNNGGGLSTIKPTGTSTSIFQTADSYKWKFMYTVPSADTEKFVSKLWIPVKTLLSDDSSTQWDIQQAAIPGAIDQIKLVTGGSNYSVIPTVTITGDGTGATATATISGGAVTGIIVTATGTNYSYANVAISGGGVGASGATAAAVVSPYRGHGADPVSELGGRFVMISATFDQNESGYFPIGNDFRRIGIITNPVVNGTLNTAFTGSLFSQTVDLYLNAITGPNYVADQTITGLTSGASGIVVSYNSVDKILSLAEVTGNFLAGEQVQNSGATTTGDLLIISGTLQNASANTVTLPNAASSVNSFYNDRYIRITTGPGAGQTRKIVSYVGLTRVATLDSNWSVNPNNTSGFSIARIELPDLKIFSGDLLLIENRRPIPRSEEQTETIKMLFEY